MPIDITLDQFNSLPRKKKDEAMFDNLQAIRKSMHAPQDCKLKDEIKTNRLIGGLWLFALSAYVGFKKYLPF